MEKKQISMLVTAMFAGVGIMSAGIVHAQQSINFVNRGNPDNALNGGCIDGSNPLCVATNSGQYVAVSTASYTAGNNSKAGAGGIAIGDRANANSKDTSGNGGGATAIGTGAQAIANSATAIGTVALAQGNTALAIGRQSAAIGDYSMALGNVADAHGKSSIALGHSALAQGDRSVAIGGANPTTSDGVSGGASYDAATQTRAGGTQSVAIGAGAQTNGDNQIAIGSGSVGANNNTSQPVFGGTAAPVGGAVSFGAVGKERQLKNVAAGVDSTDAVNISQLKSVNDGLTTSINNVDSRVTNLSTTVGGQITNLNSSLSTATTNITNLQAADQLNVKYTDSTHTAVSLDGSGGTTISNVKAGVADTDAVNVGQLNGGLSSLSTSVTNNVNTQITNVGSSLSTSIVNATKDAVQYDSSAHDSVTLGGTSATSPVALHNVAAGTADTDAVNVKQLNGGISTAVAPITQNITNLQTSLSTTNQTVNNLNTSVTNLNTSLSTATSNITQLQQADTRNVKYDGQSGFDTVTLQGTNGTTIKNVADGKDVHDAVNVGQLNGGLSSLSTSVTNNVNTQISNLSTTINSQIGEATKNAVQYDNDAHTSVTLGGQGASAPVSLHNVADGVANNDAVNVGQLNGAISPIQTSLSSAVTNITNLQGNVTNLSTSLGTTNQNVTNLSTSLAGTQTDVSNLQAADKRNVKYDGAEGFETVTLAGPNGTKLTNVKAAELSATSTDAVNGSQLYATNQTVAKQGDSITQIGGQVTQNTTDIRNIGGQVTQNTTHIGALQQDALQWSASAGAYDASHGSGSAQKITNVQAGALSATSTDAVNGSQLYATNQQVTKNTTDITNLQQNVTNVTNGKAGIVQQQDPNGQITVGAATDGTSVNFANGSNADRVLTGVAAGVNNNDAVNVGQLNGGLSSLSTSVTNNVNTQISNLSTTINSQIGEATKNAVQYDNDAHTSVTLGGQGASAPVSLHNVADGVANNDAVNVGQLNGAISPIQTSLSSAVTNITNLQGNVTNLSTSLGTTNQNVTNLSTSLAGTQTDVSNLQAADKRNVKYDGAEGFETVTLAGPNGTKLTNVKAAELSATSTDAVNGSQLYATNQTVAKQGDSITQIGGQVTQNATDIRNIGGQVTQNTTHIGALQQDALQWSASAGAYDASHGSGSAQKITNVAAGDVSTTSTDAINGAQLKQVQDQLNTQVGVATKNAVVYDTDANGNRVNSVTLAGGVTGPVKITNVAPGSLDAKSTDAVNGSQLYATNQNVATQTTRVDNLTTNVSTLTSNLSTTNTNVTNLQQADKLNVKYDGSDKNTVTLGGSDHAPVKLSNVADGVANNDAVNVGQLNGAISPIQTSLSSAVTNITNLQGNVTNLSTSLGTTNQNVTNLSTSLAGTQTDVSNLQAADKRNVKYDGAEGFETVTLAGPNGTKLTNVKAAELSATSTDAVNGSQLYATNQTVAKQGDSITQIGGQVTQNTTHIGALQQDALQWSASAGAYDASHGSGSAQKITNVAAGDVSTTSTDAINGAQLKQVQDQLNTQVGVATKNAVVYDTDANGNRVNSVTLAGGVTGPVKITNVAPGSLDAKSTDAVNGSQLYATNQNVATQTTRVDNLTTNVSTLTSNLSTTNTNVTNLQQADKLNVKYDGSDKNTVTLGGAGHAPVKLSNVADGVANNDAVNVGQLSKATGNLQQQISTQGNTITSIDQRVTTNTTNISALKQDALQWNATLGAYDASHGSAAPQQIANVAQGVKGTDAVNVDQLNDAVKTGVGALDSLAVKYDDSSKRQVSLGAGNGGVPVRVTNVAEGGVYVGSNDAVNGSQLRYSTDSVAAALGGGATANTNGSINAPKYDVGGGTFNNVGDALSNIDGRVAGNTTTIQNHETRISNAETNIVNNTTAIAGLQKDALQFDPSIGAYNAARGGAATKITNVADGSVAAGSTDAVNGGQLFGVKSDLEQQITNVSNQTGEAVKNVVKYDVDANGKRLNSVSLVGGDTASPVVLKNVAAGVDDTDAVNVKQLKGVQSSLNQLGALAVTYDDSSKSIITLGGGSGGTKITNVQAGTLSATSTDAVNGSQLYATNQQVTKNTTDITNLQQNVTNVTNGKAGLVQQQDPNGQITVGAGTGGTSVNFANGSNADRVLTGVAAGVNSNDAVNVGQLNNALKDVKTNQDIKAAATDANTTWIARADAGSFGSTSTATGKNSVAVGQGSVADRDNSFSVGAKGNERQVTNVAAGTAPTDAVNVQQLNDNVAASSAASRSYTDQRVGQVYNDLNTVKKDMLGGVASAMAVAGLPQPTAPGRSMVSAATANYRGQQGFAAGYSYVTQNDKWVVKASVTGNTRSDFGAVVGAGYQF